MRRRVLVFVTVIGVMLATGVAWATNPFVDVAGNTHEKNIDAIFSAGITSGCDGTHYCPADSVKRDQMATFLARATGLSSGTTKHFPVANARGPARSYCSYALANAGSYGTGPCGMAPQLVAGANLSGLYPSIAIGVDELPVISYYTASTAGSLSVVHCGNPSCTAGNNVVGVDSSVNDIGYSSSIAIGSDGLPVISYYDAVNGDLRIAHCETITCAVSSKTTAISVGDSGNYSSIAIGTDGFPVVASYESSAGNLYFVHCSSLDCTSKAVSIIDGNDGTDTGQYVSLKIIGGVPVMAYYDVTNQDLKLLTCANAACTGTIKIDTLDSVGDVGQYASLTVGPKNTGPVVSYFDNTNKSLKLAFCVTCTSPVTIDSGNAHTVGQGSAAMFDADVGLQIAYYDATAGDLKIASCSAAQFPGCGGGQSTIRTIDSANDVGKFPSIALGVDGKLIVAYYEATKQDLRVAS